MIINEIVVHVGACVSVAWKQMWEALWIVWTTRGGSRISDRGGAKDYSELMYVRALEALGF